MNNYLSGWEILWFYATRNTLTFLRAQETGPATWLYSYSCRTISMSRMWVARKWFVLNLTQLFVNCMYGDVRDSLLKQVQHVWNVMAHAQKPDLVFLKNGRVNLNRRRIQFRRLLVVEKCRSAGRQCIDHVPRYSARVVATLFNRLFPLHFPYHASPCAITFRTAFTRCVDTETPKLELAHTLHYWRLILVHVEMAFISCIVVRIIIFRLISTFCGAFLFHARYYEILFKAL